MAESSSTPGAGSNAPKPRKASRPSVPKADSDFGTTVTDVSKAWEQNPQITLVYTTQAEFSAKANLYITTLDERMGTGSNRPGTTSSLKETDRKLDDGIDWIKRYLSADFGKQASAHYAKFGIEKEGSNYRLPRDRDKRKNAIKLILPAIQAQGYNSKLYGKAYFTQLIADFNAQFDTAKSTDGDVAGLVSDKNTIKSDLSKVLRSLLRVLEGNYPDTWKSVIRKWGFQKEKY